MEEARIVSFGKDEASPIVIRGGWQLSTGHHAGFDKDRAITDLIEAANEGYTCLDCGDIYTGVEELIGMFRARSYGSFSGNSIRVHTKFVPDMRVLPSVSEEHVRAVIRRSLNRLGQTQLNLVQFHWWAYDVGSYVQAAQHLSTLQEEGLIRNIGITNFSTAKMREIGDAGVKLAVAQVQYSLLDRRPESDGMVALCAERGTRLVCYGVVAGGFLTDKWLGAAEPDLHIEQENRSLTKYALIIDEFGGWALFQELLRTVRKVADRHPLPAAGGGEAGVASIAMIATAWILAQPGVGAVILGARNSSHLHTSRVAASMTLAPEDLAEIQQVLDKAKGPAGEVYGLERSPKHAGVMRYCLNHIGTAIHLEELARRAVRTHFYGKLGQSSVRIATKMAMTKDLETIGLLPSELQAAGASEGGGDVAGGHSWASMSARLLRELDDIGHPATVCEGELEDDVRGQCEKLNGPAQSESGPQPFGRVLLGLLRMHLSIEPRASPSDILAIVGRFLITNEAVAVGAETEQEVELRRQCGAALLSNDAATTGTAQMPLMLASSSTEKKESPLKTNCRVVLNVLLSQMSTRPPP
jgi:aryl-alcohol dehydrogenase-like predicted oxidoreductase